MAVYISILILPLSFLPSTFSSFSLKLIHRDSPLSPLYQPNLSDFQRFSKHVDISRARASYFSTGAAQNALICLPARLQDPLFTVEIGIGTPPVKRTLIFDTGSHLTWTQCKPCIKCFKQKEPLFQPKKSLSYQPMGKKHPLAGGFTCTPFGCGYVVGYYSGQFSSGAAAVENFTFDSNLRPPATVSNLVFGCGHTSLGNFPPEISGILGMDKEPLSFAQQLGSLTKSRFSYCLTPSVSKTATSYMRFGDEARIRGGNGKKTPFVVYNKRSAMLYGLSLIDLSVNGRKLGLGAAAFPSGCFIDSGSSVSLLNGRAYSALRDFVLAYFSKFWNVERYVGSKVPKKFLCYRYWGGFKSFPSMSFHFQGAEYYVPASSMFFYIEGDVFCLAILESKDTTILGAFQQRNVRVVYDLKERMLSFAPEDCSTDLQLQPSILTSHQLDYNALMLGFIILQIIFKQTLFRT